MESEELKKMIAETWGACGVKSVRGLANSFAIFVKTEPPPKKIGSIWLPPKLSGFYGDLPHLRLIVGTVLARGGKTEVKPGDRICFMRLHFARWKDLGDEVYVGWIYDNQVIGFFEGEYVDARAFSRANARDVAPVTQEVPESALNIRA